MLLLIENRQLVLQLSVDVFIDTFGRLHLFLRLHTPVGFRSKCFSPAGNKRDVQELSSNLSNLDVVPLLGGLQRLQVVAGGVEVDQFSPPFGDFLLHRCG